MKYTHLGRAGLKVSRLCLGTMNFGPLTSQDDSFAIMDRAREEGVNFFDTANVYGGRDNHGRTEEIVGNWFAQGGGRRESTVLATKVFGPMWDGPNGERCSAYHIRRACEDSLRRLQTDHIDLYQMHHIDRETPWDEIWQAMEQLIREGKILYVGSSNFAGWNIADANHRAAARHLLGLISEQSLYNLKDRMVELEVVPACREFGVGIIPWSPLAGGLLGGVLGDQDKSRRSDERSKKMIEENRDQLEKWESFCKDLGEPPASVAIAWLLHQDTVSAPIIGPRKMEQFTSILSSVEIDFSEEQLKKLDEIWPGPGGQAPEAYAW